MFDGGRRKGPCSERCTLQGHSGRRTPNIISVVAEGSRFEGGLCEVSCVKGSAGALHIQGAISGKIIIRNHMQRVLVAGCNLRCKAGRPPEEQIKEDKLTDQFHCLLQNTFLQNTFFLFSFFFLRRNDEVFFFSHSSFTGNEESIGKKTILCLKSFSNFDVTSCSPS